MLYLVRLQHAMRFYDKDDQRTFHSATAYQKTFADFAQAYDFSIDHMPVEINPFIQGAEIGTPYEVPEPYPTLEHTPYYSNISGIVIPLDQLSRRIRTCNLTPPEGEEQLYDLDYWQDWWNATIENLSEFERVHLCRKIGLHCWLENPFYEKYIEVTYTSFNLWEVYCEPPLSRLVDYLNSTTISNPGIHSTTEQWYQWWQDSQDWNEPLKNFLWWLICPYPYEIVPVELV